jgi:Transposase DDE domain group 1
MISFQPANSGVRRVAARIHSGSGGDDPTHPDQEESYYHGYFEEHIYHPVLVFDGDTGQLISALLRAGNTHASRSTVAVLERLVGLLRSAWPGVEVELRADAGFAVPAVYDYYCEAEGIRYTIALITNSPLEELASSLLEEAQRRYEQEGGRKVRLLCEGPYQAASWHIERRVVYKAEVMEEGTRAPALW